MAARREENRFRRDTEMSATRREFLQGVQAAVCLPLLTHFSLKADADEPEHARWSPGKAAEWYAQQPWLVGSNYVPANAINQLEMWQEDTFDPRQIDRELGWAESIGMNAMRVFLHDLLWEQDSQGFVRRMDQFLTIAQKHHIRPIMVLFDSCWDPYPQLGPQHPPIPGVHNSGWVQSPGIRALRDPAQIPRLQSYVQGIISAFASDPRILAWDIWNEPESVNSQQGEEKDKVQLVAPLLLQAFRWAREANPQQPLTSGVDDGDWDDWSKLTPIEKIQLGASDILTFHHYGWPEDFERHVLQLKQYGRPVVCTEFMARSVGSTFDTILPIAVQHQVGAINWGFVKGKTQTYLPWDSWERPYVLMQPAVWFHDVLLPDGTPYRQREVEIIREMKRRSALAELR